MTKPHDASPFVPGHGQMPPYLAGRAAEREALNELLDYLRTGRGAPRNAVLSGPRGNGKTALLRWFEHEVQAANEAMDVIWLTPSEVPDMDRLATWLAPPGGCKSLYPSKPSAHLGIGRAGWELGGQSASLTSLLVARCSRRPLVLLIDEAHTLDHDLGRLLLNVGQMVCAQAPFLLVMAGTPDLQRHLDQMSATFWTRARKLAIGRLDAAAASAAVTRPLAEQTPPITFDESALRRVIDESQGYPYFLQLWGAALWRAARRRGTNRIDEVLVAAAASDFDPERTACYEDRYDELERSELLDVAARVAAGFGARATLPSRELNAVIAEALPAGHSTAQVLDCRDRLAGIGYVWKPPAAGNAWQPGIPSLMDYVRRQMA